MQSNVFTTTPTQRLKTNTFDLSHDVKMSFNMGKLYPCHIMEVLPGDTIHMSTESMLRFSPLQTPVMHRVNVFTHSFYVPNRILWDGWQDFITGGQDPSDTPAAPYIPNIPVATGSLADYLGLPIVGGAGIDKVSALPFAAYQAIYSEYYRDQNLIDPVDYKLVDGSNGANFGNLGPIRTRSWQHDYFTSALPFAQKGDPVTLPLGTSAPIRRDTVTGEIAVWDIVNQPSGDPDVINIPPKNENIGGGLFADLTNASAVTINNLRVAVALQEWLEVNARGGTRYVESIQAHFGERVPDSTAQRPIFLGGSKTNMVISEVLQTSETSESSPQGNMSGHGISVDGGKNFSYHCVEHGYVITLCSVMPVTAYQQGLHRSWFKFDRMDYYWSQFAHLGEQEIKNKELYYANDGLDNEGTFGYIPRYSEYRFVNSRVAGEFRNDLSNWHMGRIFSARPALNQSFIECDPSRRFFVVTDPDFDTIYAHFYHKIKCRRKIPLFGVPKLV